MKVNFNNVRKRALHRYEDLADMLNKSIIKTDDEWAFPEGTDKEMICFNREEDF